MNEFMEPDVLIEKVIEVRGNFEKLGIEIPILTDVIATTRRQQSKMNVLRKSDDPSMVTEGQYYDNPIIDIAGCGLPRLNDAMRLTINDKACGYSIADNQLIFYWVEPNHTTDFVSKNMTRTGMVTVAWNWLSSLPSEAWDDTRLNDGDVGEKHGWRIYTEGWGHVNNMYQAFIAVKPYCLWVGK